MHTFKTAKKQNKQKKQKKQKKTQPKTLTIFGFWLFATESLNKKGLDLRPGPPSHAKYFVKKYRFFKLGFTPCKPEQPLQGMELQEKEA